MPRVDMIVKAPHFYTMAGEGVGYQSDVAMVVDAGKILAIADVSEDEQEYEAETILVLEHHAILPGFIDAHMHTSLAILRGGGWRKTPSIG